MEGAKSFLTEDPLPISRHRAARLPLSSPVRELLRDVLVRRLEANGAGRRPFANAIAILIPARVSSRTPLAYQHEEMGYLLRDLVRVVEAGGGERDVLDFLRRQLE